MAPQTSLRLLSQDKLLLAVVGIFGYIAAICIYRRFFHPLAKVPGPFLPAVTKLYQSYYHRRYYQQIEKLHQRYGPIVRITPDEVHLVDVEHYDKIYYMGSKYEKPAIFYNALCVPHSTFGTRSNEVHRIKRGALNPMFSRQKVLELEGIVQAKADKVCKRMQQEGVEQGKPVDLHHAFRAVAVDVISDFAFDRCYDFLDMEDIGATFFEMTQGIGPALWVFQQFPSLQSIALSTPPWMAPYLSKPLGYVTGMQMEGVRQIEGVKAKMERGQDLGRQTIFTTLLLPEDKPKGYHVPTTMQMKDEAYAVLAAAADTTGNAMTVAAFHVLNNQDIYLKLAAELESRFSGQTSELPFLELEKLPYLTAVIKEGLRLSFGVIGRLPRVVPGAGATFNGYFIPGGYIVGLSAYMSHRDPDVFPDPMRFDPERWMRGVAESHRLDRNMVPFGRGSRQCLGMPLAYTEMYVMIGTLFRRFPRGLKPYHKTTLDSIQDYEDSFAIHHPMSRKDEWFKAVYSDGE